MRNVIANYLKEIARNKIKRRRMQMIVSMLSLVVVLTVFWQLRIVGISMTGEALCGKLEHAHTLECLVMQNACGQEEAEGHSHTDECHAAETVQICQKEVHSHGDECQLKREQTCEQEEHRHGGECVKTENVLICADESEGHVHTSEPTTVTTQICTKEEHSHSEECQGAEESGCEQEEHQHGDACVKTEFVPACYEARTTQVCEMDEHTHVEGQCYALTPCVCEKEEHQHDEACFETQDKLICGKEESEGHAHTPECQQEVNGCGYEEEHKHTLMCYSNAEADVETSADWEASLPALTGNVREDLVAVANSQLGYAESERNYKVADDNTTKMGYTRYGEWYGNPYGNWNAMFVSFCLNYSNHPDYAVLKNTGVETMRQAAISAGKYTAVSPDLVPAAGSVVFLDKDSNGSADRAAVVTYAGNGVISVVEGDHNGTVAAMEYSMSNGTIMGYALLPAREPQILTSTAPSPTDAPEETITITYCITDSNYTNDPGSGYTHLTVKSTDGLAVNGGLTYTSWAGRYKVTGVGTLASYSIPAGSSLSANGYTAPDIKQEDIGTGNTYSYASSISWVDGNGKICADTTVFNQDTTLYLRMYTQDSWYSLNYVCGCSGNHNANVSGRSATFTLGQSLSAPYVPTAEAVNEKYSVASCENYGKTFTGWYVKNKETNEEIDFSAGTPLLEAYLDNNAERTIKVYARWENASVPEDKVKVTFMNGEGTSAVEFKVIEDIPLGAPLWNYLPEEIPEYIGTSEKTMVFSGWGWMDGETLEPVTETTVAETDMVLYAVFEEVTNYTVYLHDMASDGVTDYEQGRIDLPVDMTLQQYLERNSYRMRHDGKLAIECKWNIKQQTEDGDKILVPYELNTPAASELHLYTRHYSVTLTRQEVTAPTSLLKLAKAAVDISQDGNTLTLTLREGEKPAIVDFVVNGVDYTLYQWTYTEAGEEKTLSISEIIANGVTENITATANSDSLLITPSATGTKTINFYVFVNKNQKLVESRTVTVYRFENGDSDGTRWYVPSTTLESVYGEYGFTESQLVTGTRYFPHVDTGGGTIWANTSVYQSNDLYFSPVTSNDTSTCDVYYLPNQTLGVDSGAYADYLETDTFYSITISDDIRLIYGADDEIPPVRYVLTGGTATVTLPDPAAGSDISWLMNGNPLTGGTSNNDGTTTYTFSDVTEPIRITTNLIETTRNVHFYVCIDDEWHLIQSGNTAAYKKGSEYWISAAQLEAIYGTYGFTADELTEGSKLFPHATSADGPIWYDRGARKFGESVFSPLRNTDDNNCHVYYLPRFTNPEGNNANKDDVKANNTFYPLTISDNLPLIYGADDEIPPVRYILTGETATVTLPDPAEDTTSWLANGYPMPEGVSNGDGTTTYTFPNVTAPIRIVAYRNNRADISYDINLTGFTPDSTAPLINGAQTYTDSVQIQEDGSYIVRTPSRTQFTVVESNAQVTVLFKGWAINGNSNMLLHAGDKLTVEQLKQYGSAINLTAQWEKQGYTKIVSFYVNLNLEVVDYNGDSIPVTSNNNYTSALYGTTLSISPEPTNGYPTSWGDGNYAGEGGGVVLTAEKSAEADALIRQFATQSISAKYGKTGDYEDRTFTLESFPDDGPILEKIRSIQAGYIRDYETWLLSHPGSNTDAYRAENPGKNKIIAVDGQYIPEKELIASNYTVRWVVFKYDDTNGWHIDGTLVKKQGQVTVKKTFFGYDPAVEEVTNPDRATPYSIAVKNEESENVTTLILSETDTANGKGYKDYDPATETYTWVIPLTADKTFTFFENNYASSRTVGGEEIASLAEYMVTNSASDVYRRTYDPDKGVSVKAKAHSVDLDYTTYETVTFYNSYIPTAAVPISKVDDFGNSLPGVSFSLYRDNVKCNIYKDNAGIYYIYTPTDIEFSEVTSGYITVDKQGYALVMGLKDIDENDSHSGYTFKLEESVVPEGYASIEDIEFTIDHDGTIHLKNTMGSVKIVDGGVLRVTNASKTMDVTVVKKWEGQKEEVQVQLVQNGKPLTLKTATLNDANEWTYTWEDMPIYFGGELAEYSIKETWIGDTAYRGIYDDGYEGYIVVVSEPVVVDVDGDGLPESATITVNNSVYEGGVQFKKIDEKGNGLDGAIFQLFTDEACTQVYGTGERSDLYGNVNFGHLVVGTYYMKEVRAPAGYQQNDTVYRITVTGSGTTLTVNGSETPISSIVNTPAAASLKIRKVDGNNNPLTGATFKVQMLTDSENNTWEDVIKDGDKEFTVEDSNGFLVIPELMPGDYKLIEITAPAGYYRRTEPILFSIVLSDISAYPNDDGWRVEVVKDGNGIVTDKYIVVENVPGSELPHTGGMGTTPVTMTGLFIMAASLYVFLLRRKREGRVE